HDTAWTTEAEDADSESSVLFDPDDHDPDDEFSGGDGLRLNQSSHNAEYEIEVEYTIPEGEFDFDFRFDVTDVDVPSSRIVLEDSDGSPLAQSDESSVGLTGPRWYSASSYGGWNPPELEPGTYTVRFECTESEAPSYLLDVVSPRDTRFDVTHDNEVHEPGGYLDGPETKPDAVEVTFDAVETPF
ncbi:hypothetical protein, partial [Aeromicrobium tamlense]|uniref:hypothetical protein n=1 Tax=Aeromicrobium tamlense TaxID=375541 RepID=UPI0031DBDAD6